MKNDKIYAEKGEIKIIRETKAKFFSNAKRAFANDTGIFKIYAMVE